MTFDPGIASMRAAGIPVTQAPYANGGGGIRQSLEAMAQQMRNGKIDAGVKGWALQCLSDKGLDGRTRATTTTAQAKAILDCLRSATIYTSDPYGTESIQSAGATLCLRPNLCVTGGDCDDLSVALGSLYLSIGLPVQIVKQNFGADAQEHVLIAVYVDGGWEYADPSTNMPFGSAAPAVDEVWVDPMEPIGNLNEAKAEIVTLGRAGVIQHHRRPQSTTPHWPGLGAPTGNATDVIAYRKIWDDYVMGTARAAIACGAAWQALVDQKPPTTPPNVSQFAVAPDAKTLTLWAQLEQQKGEGIAASWNMYAGLQDWEIMVSAGDILQDFQSIVRRVGEFYQPSILKDCPSLTLPAPPGLELQKQVIGRIEGLGIIARGTLQLFAKGAGGTLDVYETIGQKLANPTTIEIGGAGIIVGIIATVAGLYALNRLISARR
jgi:hypothetical protein